jgi:hypothetical protein
MALDEGTLRALTGGRELKQRVQHPKVQECKDRAAPYWFFRYRHDEARPGGFGEDHPEAPHLRAQQGAAGDQQEASGDNPRRFSYMT